MKLTAKKAPKSERDQRLRLISGLMEDLKAKGNPRNHIVITHARQILDVSGVYEIRCELPQLLEEGNHVWVRGHVNDREVVSSAIVIEDYVRRKTEDGEQVCVMLRDEPRTKEWLVPREDLSPLPLTMNPMLIHKRDLDQFLGDGWSDVFWNHKLRMRRAHPKSRIIHSA